MFLRMRHLPFSVSQKTKCDSCFLFRKTVSWQVDGWCNVKCMSKSLHPSTLSFRGSSVTQIFQLVKVFMTRPYLERWTDESEFLSRTEPLGGTLDCYFWLSEKCDIFMSFKWLVALKSSPVFFLNIIKRTFILRWKLFSHFGQRSINSFIILTWYNYNSMLLK